MRKIWLIAAATYRRQARSSRFLFLTFALPVIMVIAGAVPLLRAQGGAAAAVGYVDGTGQLALDAAAPADGGPALIAYADLAAAHAATARGEIAGYLAIPADYFEGAPVAYYGDEEPNFELQAALTARMRRALLPDRPDWALARLDDPSDVTYVARDTGDAVATGPAMVVRIVAPIALAIVFAIVVMTGAGQMGSAMALEKERRSMEMIITSLAPRELVAGKVLGMTLLSATQVGVWAVGAGIAIALALAGAADPSAFSVPWNVLLWAVLLGAPGYFLYALLAAGLGMIAGDNQQAQQLASILGVIGLSPLWFTGLLINAIDGPLAVALTLFPLTAPIVALIRMALTEVPTWQLVAALVAIILALLGSVWLVGRVFRAGMLMYGQRLRPRQIVRALRDA